MARRKTDRADLRKRYALHAQIGLAAALLVCTLAFRVAWNPTAAADALTPPSDDVIDVRDVTPPTEHRPKVAPPPPAPLPPVAVPDHTVLEALDINFDEPLEDLERQPAEAPPKPSPPKEEEPEVFIAVEEDPELIGGLGGLQKEVEYPEFARKAGIEGRVTVQFVVDEEGRATDLVVLKSPHKLLSEEALRVVRQARFTPGRQRGKAVRVQMALPITFNLR